MPKVEDINASDELALVALTGKTHISAEEAQQIALATAMQMREIEGIATKSPLQIASIEVVTKNERKPYVPTKSGETPEQGDVYVINFANNQGYVVTSADRRVSGVLAYNSSGKIGDEPSNPGQAILFDYIQEYIEQERENFEKNKEALKIQAEEHIFKQLPKEEQQDLIVKGFFDEKGKRIITKRPYPDTLFENCSQLDTHYDYGQIKTVYVKSPLLKTLWGQSGLYNNKVGIKCGNDEAPVGCVATAVGQLMAYHKKPSIFKGRTMNWDEMTKADNSWSVNPTAQEDIQHLLARLGDGDLLAMDYGCDGSGSNRAFEALRNIGYNDASYVDYNNYLVVNEIRNNRPIYIEGYAFKHTQTWTTGWWLWKKTHSRDSYSGGHAWVLDGYVLKEQDVTSYTEVCPTNTMITEPFIVSTYKNKIELVHNNFGWSGIDNGWYHIGIFDTNGQKEGTSTYKSGTTGNYQFKNKIITNIR